MSSAVAETDVLKSVNPYNGDVLKTYDEMPPAEVDSAIAKADVAFRQLSIRFRGRTPACRWGALRNLDTVEN